MPNSIPDISNAEEDDPEEIYQIGSDAQSSLQPGDAFSCQEDGHAGQDNQSHEGYIEQLQLTGYSQTVRHCQAGEAQDQEYVVDAAPQEGADGNIPLVPDGGDDGGNELWRGCTNGNDEIGRAHV